MTNGTTLTHATLMYTKLHTLISSTILLLQLAAGWLPVLAVVEWLEDDLEDDTVVVVVVTGAVLLLSLVLVLPLTDAAWAYPSSDGTPP